MSDDQSNWRELAEQASTEQDSEKLMILVERLTGMLSRRDADRETLRTKKYDGQY